MVNGARNNGSIALPEQLAEADTRMLWDVIVNDTDCRVAIVDRDGKVAFANDEANRRYADKLGGASIVGRNISEFLPADFAAEWLGFIRQVADSGNPVLVDGMLGGVKIRSVLRSVRSGGKTYVLGITRNLMSPYAVEPETREYREVVVSKARDLGPLSSLTDREMQVLTLIGEGLSTAAIAAKLHRSVKTVEWHRASLGSKLGVTNRVELARIAIRAGLCQISTDKARDEARAEQASASA